MPKIGVILAVDGENEFSAAMKNATSAVQATKSEIKALTTEFSGNANSLQALTAKQEALTKHQSNLKAATEAAKSGLENAKRATDEHRSSVQQLDSALGQEKAKLDSLKAAYGADADAVKKQEQAVEDLTQTQKEEEAALQQSETVMNRWQKRVNDSTTAEKKNTQAIEQNEKYLDEAKNSADKCATSIDKFGKKTKQAGDDAKKAGKDWKEAFKIGAATAVMNAVGNAAQEAGRKVVEAGKYVVEVGSSFEAAMSNVQALSGAETGALDKLSKKAQELGRTTKFSATEAANAFGYMSLAGWDTQQMLEGIDGVLQLAAASDMELAQASDMVTDYLSAFNMEASEATKMADMLAYAQAHSNTTAQQLGEAYGNCAAGLNTAGQSIDTVTALLEAMANQGTKGSEAGTALNGIMSQITQKMQDGAIQIGETSVAVQDQEGNFRDLIDILADVEAATDDMGTAEKSSALAAVFNRTSLSGLNQVLNEGVDKVKSYRDELSKASGSASDMAGVMQDNLKGDLTTMNSALEGLGIAAYDYVDGPLRGAVQGITGMISGITDAITPQKTALDGFVDEIEAGNDRVEKLLQSASDTLAMSEADVDRLESYKDILLDVAEAGEANAYQRSVISGIVGELGGAIPELAAAWDAETGSINASTEAIEGWFDAYESSLMKSALLDAQKASWDALTEATINKAKADSAVKTAEEDIQSLQENEKTLWKDGLSAVQDYNDELGDLQDTRRDAIDAQYEANSQMEEAKAQYENTSAAIKDLADQYGISVDELKGMGDAEEEAADSTEELDDALSELDADKLEEITDAAEQMRDSIETSMKGVVSAFDEFKGGQEVTAEEVIKNLDSQIEGLSKWSENMAKLGAEAGDGMSQELYDYLAEMGPESANLVQTLVSSLEAQDGSFEEISAKWGEALKLSENADVIASFTTQGQELAAAYAEAIESGALGVQSAAQGVADSVLQIFDTTKAPMTAEGLDNIMSFSGGVTAGTGEATSAASAVASASASGARDYSGFYSSGSYSASGLAAGIRSGRSGAVSAAIEIMRAAVAAAKSEAQIASPSKKWEREVGLQLAKGAAKGLKSGEKIVIASAKQLIKITNKTAKKLHEKSFTADFFGVDRYETKGTGKKAKKVKKDLQTYYSDMYDAAKSYMDKMQTVYNVSEKAELKYWKNVQSHLKKGTNAWYDAQSQINKLQESIEKAAKERKEAKAERKADQRKELASTQQKLLKDYKVYYNVSLKAEMEYWNKARKQYKKGTQERIDADEEYLNAKAEYNEKLLELDEEYAENEKKIQDDLAEEIKDLTQTYEDSVADRKKAILSSFSLFDAWDAEGYTKEALLQNIKTQVDSLKLWEREIEKLRKKNLPAELMEQLEEMGPEATASLWSLNQMTSEELNSWVAMWKEKNEIADRQAKAENESLLKETNTAIKKAQNTAKTSLAQLKKDYDKAVNDMSKSLESGLEGLLEKASSIGEETVAKYIAGLEKAAKAASSNTNTTGSGSKTQKETSSEDKIKAELKKIKSSAAITSADVSKALAAGLITGMEAYEYRVAEAAMDMVKLSTAKMKIYAKIHSPSGLWRDEIGKPLMAGAAEGIIEEAENAGKTAQKALEQMTNTAMSGSTDFAPGGIATINGLINASGAAQQVFTLEGGQLASEIANMSAEIRDMKSFIAGLGMYINDDVLVGQIQPKMSQEMAAASIRYNRGSF